MPKKQISQEAAQLMLSTLQRIHAVAVSFANDPKIENRSVWQACAAEAADAIHAARATTTQRHHTARRRVRRAAKENDDG
ncbi:hypothetical protein [uncultured Pleomorphomonas sp.]|nr:hypothetical protein [uncultured Pleomorphomonas sp.]